MGYSCNACGRWIEGGGSCGCYAPSPSTDAVASEAALLATLRSLLGNKPLYVMARAHMADESKPLYEIRFGTVLDGKILFTQVEK